MKLKKHPPLMHTVIACIISFSFVFILSCTDDKVMSCDGGDLEEVVKNDTLGQTNFQFLNVDVVPGTVYFNYPNLDKVRFSIGMTLSNVCPFESLLIKFNTKAINLDSSQIITLIGRAEWHSSKTSSTSVVINRTDPLMEDHIYESLNDIDMSDIIGNDPASIDLLISVEFGRLNSFDEEKSFFLEHFKSLQIEASGQLYQ